jgi:hypothetical protein
MGLGIGKGAVIALIAAFAVAASTTVGYVYVTRNRQAENVLTVADLLENLEYYENKEVVVTGKVSYFNMVGIPEAPRFWLDGVIIAAPMGVPLPFENFIITAIVTIYRTVDNASYYAVDNHIIYMKSWTVVG